MKKRFSDADQYDLLLATSKSQATINIALNDDTRKYLSELRKMSREHDNRRRNFNGCR